jgi:hypothetical protein
MMIAQGGGLAWAISWRPSGAPEGEPVCSPDRSEYTRKNERHFTPTMISSDDCDEMGPRHARKSHPANEARHDKAAKVHQLQRLEAQARRVIAELNASTQPAV